MSGSGRRVLRVGIALLALAAGARALSAEPPAPPSLELDVEAPSWTRGPVFVALDRPWNGLPAWTANAVPLAKDAQGRWRASLPLAEGTRVAWKVTRGDWRSVEKSPLGGEIANRTAVVQGRTTAYGHVCHWADDAILPPPGALQDLGVFRPRALGTERRVFALLPPGYDAPANAGRRYPVLYALDGQNLFDPSRAAFGVVWDLGGAVARHVARGGAPFITVAIDNTPGRMGEYTPSRDPAEGGGGSLADLASFLFDELKPAVDALYRTSPAASDTGILGSSLGGLAALRLGLDHPDRVTRVGALSPSFWWNGQEMLAVLKRARAKPPLRVWLDIGTNEGSNPRRAVRNTRAVEQELVRLGFREGNDLHYVEVAGASHDERSWAARVGDVLGFLFPARDRVPGIADLVPR